VETDVSARVYGDHLSSYVFLQFPEEESHDKKIHARSSRILDGGAQGASLSRADRPF
jgi:hypothetical protein